MVAHLPITVPVEDSNNNYTTLRVPNHLIPNPLSSENSFQLWYPLLIVSPNQSTSLSMIGNYLDLLNPVCCSSTPTSSPIVTNIHDDPSVPDSNPSPSSCFGEYLVAVAVHPYVNQINRMLPAPLPHAGETQNQRSVESALPAVTVVDAEPGRS